MPRVAMRFARRWRDAGVATAIHYPTPIHLQKAFAYLGQGAGSCPVAERSVNEMISLPMFPDMTRAQVDRVVRRLCSHRYELLRSSKRHGTSATRRGHRRRLRRARGGAAPREGAGTRHAARSPQSSPVPAAALSGRDRGAEPGRHRVSDPRRAREASERARAARRGRSRSTSRRARSSSTTARSHYDFLVVATGATHSYFGKDQWATLAPGLKSVEDALEIRRRIFLAYEAAERESDPAAQREWLTFAVVGGGPTGVELAGALGEIGLHTLAKDFRSIDPTEVRVVLFEGKDRVLGTYPAKLSEAAKKSLESVTSTCA